MSRILTQLEEICTAYRWQPKLLLAPSRSQGHILIEALARRGVPWLNLQPITVTELAYRAAEHDMRRRHLQVLNEIEQIRLIRQILESLNERQELNYFADLFQLGVLEPLLTRSVNELRLAGVTSEDLACRQLVSGSKGHELTMLLSDYEGVLEDYHLVDITGLYQRAAALISEGWQQQMLLIPDQLEMPYWAREMIGRIPTDSCILLHQEKVQNITPPKQQLTDGIPSAGNGMERLYAGQISPNLDISIATAYGHSNEVREVLRQVLTAGIPLDNTLLCYTDTSVYNHLVYTVTAAAGIPATFSAGIPLHATRPGRFLLLLLEWIAHDYAAADFYRLLMDGYVNRDFDVETGNLWREAAVGWGYQRYLPALQRGVLQAQGRQSSNSENDIARWCQLIDFSSGLLAALIPPADSNAVDFAELCQGLIRCVQQYSRQETEAEADVVKSLTAILENCQSYYTQPVTLNRAINLLCSMIKSQAVSISGPRPGCLHICHFRDGEWCGRENTFVIGLDADTFPGIGQQDPVLLDEERQVISNNLSIKVQETTANIYRFTRFLSTRIGKLTLLFSCYDTVNFRQLLPSSLLLQVYRLISGCLTADYTDLQASLPVPANFLPRSEETALSDGEWWADCLLARSEKRGWWEALNKCYPQSGLGLQAESNRDSIDFTVYDGKIDVGSRLDPRGQQYAVSASSLETLGKCPFAYYLRYVLRIYPPTETSTDSEVWLDPMQRGTLLHDIYCSFGRAGHVLSPQTTNILHELALDALSRYKDLIPVPSDFILEQTRDEVIRGLEVFLRLYYQEDADYEPAYFEVPFGFGEEEVQAAGIGLADALGIELPDGSHFHIRGRIDRLDRPLTAGGYKVWDYKTGGHSHYRDKDYVKQGRQIQHLLYTLAAQAILDQADEPGARVEAAGYLFPTTKGEGHIITRSTSDISSGLHSISRLLDLLAAGSLGSRHDDEECHFCDYSLVCRHPLASQRMRRKMEADTRGLLQTWKELQEDA